MVEKRADGTEALRFIGEEIEEDKTLLEVLQPYVDKAELALSEIVGYAEGNFFSEGSRELETALGDLIADSMRWATKGLGVDFAIQNGGGIRAALPEGKITKKTIYEILPFPVSPILRVIKNFCFLYIAQVP